MFFLSSVIRIGDHRCVEIFLHSIIARCLFAFAPSAENPTVAEKVTEGSGGSDGGEEWDEEEVSAAATTKFSNEKARNFCTRRRKEGWPALDSRPDPRQHDSTEEEGAERKKELQRAEE